MNRNDGAPAESPCVRNCCLDDADVCLGCYRTLREICDWHTATDAQKREILMRCDERRAQHVSRPRTRGF